MAISLYDATVTGFLQTLGAVSGFLEKGRAHLIEAGKDPDAFVETQLHGDMLPFRFQLVSVAHHSRGAIEGCKAGVFLPPPASEGLKYADLQARVTEAIAYLKALTPEEVNGLDGRDVIFQLGERQLPFTADGFLLSFSLPNFHFHAATAYDILRQAGAPLGKRDYLGQMRMKLAPVT
jgi:uncharacterized protein